MLEGEKSERTHIFVVFSLYFVVAFGFEFSGFFSLLFSDSAIRLGFPLLLLRLSH